MKEIKAKLKLHKTNIYIGRNLDRLIIETLSKTSEENMLIISKSAYPQIKHIVKEITKKEVLILDSKERHKNLRSLEKLAMKLYGLSISRKSRIIGIGGGMVGDYIGFLASTYMRGVEFIYIPTTLVSQCDPMINKTSLNIDCIKNLIGNFYSPSFVFCDVNYINSLPVSAMNHGMSEIVKHALIKNSKLFKILVHYVNNDIKRENYNWEQLIYESLKIKLLLVNKDYFDEKGKQVGLNYGHTFAHALEDYTNYSCPHGHSVAIGINLAGIVSNNLGLLSKKDFNLQTALLKLTHLDLALPPDLNTNRFISLLKRCRQDKSRLSLILLNKLGKYKMYNNIDEELVKKIINENKEPIEAETAGISTGKKQKNSNSFKKFFEFLLPFLFCQT